MAWFEQYPSVPGGDQAARALRLPLGVASPLWFAFGAAASAGLTYWWLTQWTRKVNIEALAAPAKLAPVKLAPAAAPPVVAPPVVEAEAPAPVAEAVSAVVEAVEALPPEPEAPEADLIDDDLTVMVGIGPKLAAALAERGVTRFGQIAAWTAEDLAAIDKDLSLKGRAVRDAWVAQAGRFAAGS